MLQVNAGLEGIFQLKVYNEDMSVKHETPEFKNIVLDIGLDRMSVGAWLGRCAVGAGNSVPHASQTQLDNFIASTTARISVSTSVNKTPPYYQEIIYTYRFGQGVAAGNLSEVAVGWGNAATGSDIFDRALIKDTQGNPTTITVLTNEFLDVVFTLRIYYAETHKIEDFSLLDGKGGVIKTMSVESYVECVYPKSNTYNDSDIPGGTAVSWRGYAGNYGSTQSYSSLWSSVANFGNETTRFLASNIFSYGDGESASTIYPTSRSAICTATIPINKANGNFIGGYINTSLGFIKWKFSEPFTKSNTEQLTIRVQISWGRYEPT